MSSDKLEILLSQLHTDNADSVRDVIISATEIPGLFVFGEFVDHPAVKKLSNGPYNSYVDLLNLFCYGSYESYVGESLKYPELSVHQLRKLKQLSIIDEAHEKCSIPYESLFKKLGISSSRELEDLIIDLFYLEALSGKLDQKRAFLEVESAVGRDIRVERVPEMSKTLDMWVTRVESVLLHTANEIKLANEKRIESELHQKRILNEASSLKATLRTTSEADAARMEIDDHMLHPDLLPDSRMGLSRTASTNAESPGGDRDGQGRMGVFRGLRRGNR